MPGGRVGVCVPGRIERSPAFAAVARFLELHAGVGVAAAVYWLFSLPEPDDLRALMAAAGFDDIRVRATRMTTRVASVLDLLGRFVTASAVGAPETDVGEQDRGRVVADLEVELARWVDAGGLTISGEANAGVARSGSTTPTR